MEFWQNFDWSLLLRCFIVGGFICIIGQILIDKTKLTPARILVMFVTIGTILGGLGIYKYLVDYTKRDESDIYSVVSSIEKETIENTKYSYNNNEYEDWEEDEPKRKRHKGKRFK